MYYIIFLRILFMSDMVKKLIVRIAEGLGNQLFMYANSLALSEKINYKY